MCLLFLILWIEFWRGSVATSTELAENRGLGRSERELEEKYPVFPEGSNVQVSPTRPAKLASVLQLPLPFNYTVEKLLITVDRLSRVCPRPRLNWITWPEVAVQTTRPIVSNKRPRPGCVSASVVLVVLVLGALPWKIQALKGAERGSSASVRNWAR